MNYILEYWEQIEDGKVIACRRLKQQMAKLVEEIRNPRDPWVFDLDKASRPIEFIERFCKHSKGKWIGQPFRLELFQKAIIQAIFGFVHKETGLRRCQEAIILVGRKNGKSSLMAALGLYMMIGDGEGGAEVYSIATKYEQARIVFGEAVNMVSQSPHLRQHIRKRKTDLYFPATFAKFQPLASESHSLDGLNSHHVIIDELHAIKDRNLYDVMKQSTQARTQPLITIISTAGYVREGIFDELYDYACKVLDGTLQDERFLAFIYELDSKEEWLDYRMWEKANPGLGTIKSYEQLADNVERARKNPSFLPTVLTKDFNVRETVSSAWLSFAEANNEEVFDLEELRGCYAVGGVDLSATTDLTAAALLVMRPGSEKIYAVVQSFMPADLVEERAKEDMVPYDIWVQRGLITPSRGNRVDYRDVTDWFLLMRERYGIYPYWVGYDSWNSPAWVEDMETRMGFERNKTLIPVTMGAKTLSTPMKLLRADLGAKRINYNNNPVLKWALTNLEVETDKNENIRPVKGRNKRQRIDPAVALIIAYTILLQVYDDYRNLNG
ncbi:MAG: terminase large subunit [Marinobacterium sp.]